VPSAACENAIADAQRVGCALLKSISANDVGLTGSHQVGYYLPKKAWRIFAPFAPVAGENREHIVDAVWPNGRVTQSAIKWYGVGTRSEYRMTRFGRGFPYLSHDCVGSLLVLIPESDQRFLMYVLDLEEDIEEIESVLGVETVAGWATYERDGQTLPETEDECLDRLFRQFEEDVTQFPTTDGLAREARRALEACVRDFLASPLDRQLLRCVEAEYVLFQMVERKLCTHDVLRGFRSINDFLKTANSILQRRKARAGRSLEHHFEHLLKKQGIPHEIRVKVDGTSPDVLIPGTREYLDRAWPERKLFVVGVKRTCRDRWRQVLREAPRVRRKHLLTIQDGISVAQIDEMRSAHVELIVPRDLHKDYPKARRAQLLTIEKFLNSVRVSLSR
jgi:type II restriction enzyme